MVMVSLPMPALREPREPAPLASVRLLLPAPRSRLPLNEPTLLTEAESLPLESTMLSIPANVTVPRLPLPAPLIVRLLLPRSLLATLRESEPLPPSIVMVELAALLSVKPSLPARPFTVSKPEKVVVPPVLPKLVPAPVPVTVIV